jgi:hypothetical protein
LTDRGCGRKIPAPARFSNLKVFLLRHLKYKASKNVMKEDSFTKSHRLIKLFLMEERSYLRLEEDEEREAESDDEDGEDDQHLDERLQNLKEHNDVDAEKFKPRDIRLLFIDG